MIDDKMGGKRNAQCKEMNHIPLNTEITVHLMMKCLNDLKRLCAQEIDRCNIAMRKLSSVTHCFCFML